MELCTIALLLRLLHAVSRKGDTAREKSQKMQSLERVIKKRVIPYLIIIPAIYLGSCHSYFYKSINKDLEIDNSVMKISIPYKPHKGAWDELIHVQFGLNDCRHIYTFYNDSVIKYERKHHERGILYRLTFDNSNTSSVSHLDSLVFKKVKEVSDSLHINIVPNILTATGFIVENK